jgi:hypothetical protein
MGHLPYHDEAVDIETAGPAGFITPDTPAQGVPGTRTYYSLITGLHSFPCHHPDYQPSRDETGVCMDASLPIWR